ncbi:HAD-IA family hydrolase [Candidatus Parvarchaeota archaeon]|nr:HAD-IA family hydrolase [Candidatus Parvarchaeota archaeon]
MLKAILFDIDGVLIDSKDSIITMFVEVLGSGGYAAARDEIEKALVGHTTAQILKNLATGITQVEVARMQSMMSARLPKSLTEFRPTAILEAIPQLSKTYLIAAVSNRRKSSHAILEHFGVRKYFGSIKTADDYLPKPAPDMIRAALKELGASPFESLFIGDNEVDLEAGRAANVKTKLVATDITKTEFFALLANLEN